MSERDTEAIRATLTLGIEDAASAAAARFSERAERERLADVAYASFESPLGLGYVAITERGLVGLMLPGGSEEDFLAELAAGISPRLLELPARLDEVRRELDQYFAGERRSFDLALDWRLVRSPFSARVLKQTAKLPYGVTSTYGEVAAKAGNPRAHRAAGSALGRNPIPLVVPCHRVLRAGGVLGNYGGGPEMKAFLLRLEGALT